MPNVRKTLLGENRPASGEGMPQRRWAGLPRLALVHRSPWLVRLQGLSSTTGGGRGGGRERVCGNKNERGKTRGARVKWRDSRKGNGRKGKREIKWQKDGVRGKRQSELERRQKTTTKRHS